MKKLIIILLILTSCSSDNDPCDCYKTTYKTEIVTVIVNGVREERWQRNILSYDEIKCSDEVTAQYIGDDKYIDIECY